MTLSEYLVVASFDFFMHVWVDSGISQWAAVVRGALKDGEVTDFFGYSRYQLHRGRAGVDRAT